MATPSVTEVTGALNCTELSLSLSVTNVDNGAASVTLPVVPEGDDSVTVNVRLGFATESSLMVNGIDFVPVSPSAHSR